MTDDLRTRIAKVLFALNAGEDWNMEPLVWEEATESYRECWFRQADAVIRELTDAIPPIVATAIRGYVVAELAAISHHGEVAEYEMLKRLDREALQIARYATTHKDWNG